MKRSRSQPIETTTRPTKRQKHHADKRFWNLNANCLGKVASFLACFEVIDFCEVLRSSLAMRSKEPHVRALKIIGNRIADRLAIIYSCTRAEIQFKLLSAATASIGEVPLQVLFNEIWPNSTARFMRDTYVPSKDNTVQDWFVNCDIQMHENNVITTKNRPVSRATLRRVLLKAQSNVILNPPQPSDWFWLHDRYIPMHGVMYTGSGTTIYNVDKLRQRIIVLPAEDEDDLLGDVSLQARALSVYGRNNFVIENSTIRGRVIDLGETCIDDAADGNNLFQEHNLTPVSRCSCRKCRIPRKTSQIAWNIIRLLTT